MTQEQRRQQELNLIRADEQSRRLRAYSKQGYWGNVLGNVDVSDTGLPDALSTFRLRTQGTGASASGGGLQSVALSPTSSSSSAPRGLSESQQQALQDQESQLMEAQAGNLGIGQRWTPNVPQSAAPAQQAPVQQPSDPFQLGYYSPESAYEAATANQQPSQTGQENRGLPSVDDYRAQERQRYNEVAQGAFGGGLGVLQTTFGPRRMSAGEALTNSPMSRTHEDLRAWREGGLVGGPRSRDYGIGQRGVEQAREDKWLAARGQDAGLEIAREQAKGIGSKFGQESALLDQKLKAEERLAGTRFVNEKDLASMTLDQQKSLAEASNRIQERKASVDELASVVASQRANQEQMTRYMDGSKALLKERMAALETLLKDGSPKKGILWEGEAKPISVDEYRARALAEFAAAHENSRLPPIRMMVPFDSLSKEAKAKALKLRGSEDAARADYEATRVAQLYR